MSLMRYIHVIHYHDMNENIARCIVELHNKQDKLEIAIDELKYRASNKSNK